MTTITFSIQINFSVQWEQETPISESFSKNALLGYGRILHDHPVVCANGVLTALKMQARNDGTVNYAHACDDLDRTENRVEIETEFVL